MLRSRNPSGVVLLIEEKQIEPAGALLDTFPRNRI